MLNGSSKDMPSRKEEGGGGLEKSSSHMTQTLPLKLTFIHTKGTVLQNTKTHYLAQSVH